MAAPLSVIIPTFNAGPVIAGTIAALFEGLESGLIRELIISDGGSDDHIAHIANDLGAVLITSKKGRGNQLRSGAGAASGDWLLFLHADTALQPGWSRVAHNHINTHPEMAGYFRLAFHVAGLPSQIVAAWANFRSRVFQLPYGDQGLLISRDLYNRTGGYSQIPLMEDVEMARLLKGHLTPLNAVAQTNATKFQDEGWFRRGRRNLFTLLRYFLGTEADKLADSYYRRSNKK